MKNIAILEAKLEELAFLALIDDAAADDLIDALCHELSSLARNEGEERLCKAFEWVVAQRSTMSSADKGSTTRSLVTTAQRYIKEPSGTILPNELEQAVSPASHADAHANLDAELLSEFIGQHTLALDEFEVTLLESARADGEERRIEIDRHIRSYLHTLKGDAGTVGLVGIEQVAHHIEDIFVQCAPSTMIPLLLEFKEWVHECLRTFTEGKSPRIPAAQFISHLSNHTEPASVVVDTKEAATPQSDEAEPYTITGETDIFLEFLGEIEDHLLAIEGILLEEGRVVQGADLDAIFRAMHSIKGGSAYFNLVELIEISHLSETILDTFRAGKIQLSADTRDLFIVYTGLVRELFGAAKFAWEHDKVMYRSEPVYRYLERARGSKGDAPSPSRPTPVAKTPEPAKKFTPAEPGAKAEGEKLDVRTFVKVDTTRLDLLIDYIGEMVISSSMLIKNCRDYLPENKSVMSTSHQLEKIAREMQALGTAMRLVPIRGLFQKMSRLVWDTAKKLGKEVNFSMEGEETELDRTVVERIADPLMHMVRNAMDHGLEYPDERVKTGKSRAGQVTLSAYHRGGHIHIDLSDDGRGIDPDKIFQKAVEKGIISAQAKLTTQEIFQLIFEPGFSTADKVTDLSGRGVGMDVVRRNIEGLRGRVTISSQVGQGTKFSVELPLTLAIIDGMETAVGRERFILPTHSIIEFVKPTRAMITTTFGRDEVLNFRGRFLPIVRLHRLFGVGGAKEEIIEGTLVIVESAGETIAVLLDEVLGTYSTMIKTLGEVFRDTCDARGVAGCAILPSGDVGLILDVPTLIELARAVPALHGDVTSVNHEMLQ